MTRREPQVSSSVVATGSMRPCGHATQRPRLRFSSDKRRYRRSPVTGSFARAHGSTTEIKWEFLVSRSALGLETLNLPEGGRDRGDNETGEKTR